MKDWVADVVAQIEHFPVVIDLDQVTSAVMGDRMDARFQLPGMSEKAKFLKWGRIRRIKGVRSDGQIDLRTKAGRAMQRHVGA